MTAQEVTIGSVKRDISEVVNRVASGGERIIVTSRGKPKAAIVSIEDFKRLQKEDVQERVQALDAWKVERDRLFGKIMAHRKGKPIDVEKILEANKKDLESRHDFLF